MRTKIALLLSQYSSCYNAHKFTAQTTCYPIQTYHFRQYASIGINTPYELKHFCYNVIVFLIEKKIINNFYWQVDAGVYARQEYAVLEDK